MGFTKSAGKGKQEKHNIEDSENALLDFLKSKGIKATKTVESAVWKWEDGVPKYFRVLSVPAKSEKRANQRMEPATTCKVVDLETGAHYTLILNAVLLSGLSATYSGEEIIGKCFVALRSAPTEGKSYANFETYEVPDPDNE